MAAQASHTEKGIIEAIAGTGSISPKLDLATDIVDELDDHEVALVAWSAKVVQTQPKFASARNAFDRAWGKIQSQARGENLVADETHPQVETPSTQATEENNWLGTC